MYSIGDIARLAGVTVRAVRHYGDLGLFKPAFVDPDTSYRRYRPEQLATLHRILALKELGFSLADIASLVGESIPPEQMRGILRLRCAELAADLQATAERLARVERHLSYLDITEGTTTMTELSKPTDLSISTRRIEALHVAQISAISPSWEPSDIGPTISPLYPRLFERLAVAGISWTPPVLGLYLDDETTGGIRAHAAVCVAADQAPVDGLEFVTLPVVEQAVVAVHEGSMAEVARTYAAILEWVTAHGLRAIGYSREDYLHCPANVDEWRTELQFEVSPVHH